MKNYNEFINEQNQLNEGLFSFIGGLFKKAAAAIRKIKGGKEIEKIFNDYLAIIKKEFSKQAGVDLELGGEVKSVKSNPPASATTESYTNVLSYKDFLNEAEVAVQTGTTEGTTEDKKMTADTLKKKSAVLRKILDLYKAQALKKMNDVLTKQGGPEKNPKLKILIDLKKDDFELKFLDAEVKYLEQSGDKVAMQKVASQRDKLAKDLNKRWDTIDKEGNVNASGDTTITVGSFYRYKTDEGQTNIQITAKSDKNDGKITAKYLNAEDGKIEPQPFTIANIDTDDTTITVGTTYGYRTKDGTGELIDVKVSEAPKDGKVKVTTEKSPDGFYVLTGLLRKKPEETPPTETPTE